MLAAQMGGMMFPAAIATALGQQISSAPMLPDLTVGRSRRLGRAPVLADDLQILYHI